MNNTPKSGLAGSKTEKSLRDAASNEALAHIRYMLYSDIAKESGDLEASRQFDRLAGHEKEHAELWMSYLDELSDTEENLDRAMRGESYEANEYYNELSRLASEEGFTEIAEKFRLTGAVEAGHLEDLNRLSSALADGSLTNGDAQTEWICTNCGYRTKGNTPPDRCPLCGYPKRYFSKY